MTDLLTDNVRDPGPGVHVVVHDDPLAAGRVIAERIGARLVDTPVEAEAAVHHRLRLPELRSQRERLDQIEMLAWGLPEAEDESFLARERELEQVARRHSIDIATVERIAALTRELESLEHVRTGTERRVREEMIDALGATMPHTVVLHPTSLRTAAARVRAAEEALADARLALDLVPVAVPSVPAAARDQAAAPPPPAPSSRSLLPVVAAVVVGVLGSLACVGAGLPVPAAVAPAIVGLLLALLLARRRRSPGAVDQRVAAPAPTPHVPGPDERSSQPDARMLKRTETVRTIEERLGVARRDWGVVAGFDADPEDIDDGDPSA